MLIYSGSKAEFDNDVINHMIARNIEKEFLEKGLSHNNDREFAA